MCRSQEIRAYARSKYFPQVNEATALPNPKASSTELSTPSQSLTLGAWSDTATAFGKIKWARSRIEDSYGTWRIVIAQRAIRHFRELQSRETRIYDTLEKRIR